MARWSVASLGAVWLLSIGLMMPTPAQAYLLPHGEWTVGAGGPDATERSGTLVVERVKRAWDLTWRSEGGTRKGWGDYRARRGKKHLYGVWGGADVALAVYTIGADGTLTGSHRVKGAKKKEAVQETLVGPIHGKIVGAYALTRTLAKGQVQQGVVTIRAHRGGYRLTYVLPDRVTTGLGLVRDGVLVVALGAQVQGVSRHDFDDDLEERAEGVWLGLDAKSAGGHALTRPAKARVRDLGDLRLGRMRGVHLGAKVTKLFDMLGDPKHRSRPSAPDRTGCSWSLWTWKNYQAEVCNNTTIRALHCHNKCRAWLKPGDIRVGTLETYVDRAFGGRVATDQRNDVRLEFEVAEGRVSGISLMPAREPFRGYAPWRPGLRDVPQRPGLRDRRGFRSEGRTRPSRRHKAPQRPVRRKGLR